MCYILNKVKKFIVRLWQGKKLLNGMISVIFPYLTKLLKSTTKLFEERLHIVQICYHTSFKDHVLYNATSTEIL